MAHRVELGFDRGAGPIAWAIRKRDRSPVAHVRIWIDGHRWEAIAGVGVITSQPFPTGPVKIARPECWDHPRDVEDEYARLYWPCWTPNEIKAATAWLNDQVGKGYDNPGVIAFATGSDRENAERQRERKGNELWFCSELAAAFGLRHDHPLTRRCHPFQNTPWDCFRSNALLWAIQGEGRTA